MVFEYYTVKQAARFLAIEEDDVFQLIETGNLQGGLYSHRKQYILAGWSASKKGWIGIATACYTGFLKPHPSWIQSLVQEGEITLDQFAGPIWLSKCTNIAQDNPFLYEDLPSGLSQWRSEVVLPESACIRPLPRQSQSTFSHISKLVGELGKAMHKHGKLSDEEASSLRVNEPVKMEFVYDYSRNGQFFLKDLRFSHSELQILRKPSPSLKQLPSARICKWCDSKDKPIRIDEVIERLYLENPKKTAKLLFRELENAFNADSIDRYDPENVVEAIDGDSLDWRTKEKKIKSLSFKSFSNKVSSIRSFYQGNLSE